MDNRTEEMTALLSDMTRWLAKQDEPAFHRCARWCHDELRRLHNVEWKLRAACNAADNYKAAFHEAINADATPTPEKEGE